MNFTDGILSVDLVLESGGVPLLIGESGIGKTALVKKICADRNYYCIIIDGNMLKEGEIGGLPTVEEYEVIIENKSVKKKRTVYAVHSKLQEIDIELLKNPDRKILLFVDEINRCEHAVQQELMNIVLNREINGYVLPDNVLVIAAMNPSDKYDSSVETDYMVVDMDAAQEDRFVWIEMEADVNSWIAWGTEYTQQKGIKCTRIDEMVLDFISSFPQYLHTPRSMEMVKATPRSWERVSNVYRIYKQKGDSITQRIFFNVVKGNVGTSIAQEFCTFIHNNKNPLIKPYRIFKDGLNEELKGYIKGESHSRLYLIARNSLKYIEELESRGSEIDIFSELLQLYPPDLKLGIMKEIREDYKDTLYKEFILNDKFVEGYFHLYTGIEG
jgi:hypothetical protein